MAVSLSIFPLTPVSLSSIFFCIFLPTLSLSFSLITDPVSLSILFSLPLLSLSLSSIVSIFPAPSLSVALSLSPTVHTVCHSFISLSLLPLSFLLFFPLWLSLSPNVTVFLSYSLSLPACLSFYHSLSYHVTLSIFFSICGSLYLSPTPDPVSLSIFNSLTHPVSLYIFLSLPPNFYFFLTLCGSASFSQHVSLFIFSLCLPCSLSLPTLSLFQSFSLSHPVSFSSTMPLYLCLPLRLSHKERER